MNGLGTLLDATWKRVLAALVISGAIILSISTFAESTYVQSRKVQIESARGQHCQKWQVTTDNGTEQVACLKWAVRK